MEQDDWYFIGAGAGSVLLMAAAAATASLQVSRMLWLFDAAAILTGMAAVYYLVLAGRDYGGDIIRPIMLFCVGAPLFVLAFHMPTMMALLEQGTLQSVLLPGFWTGAALTAMMAGFILIAYGFHVFHQIGQSR